MMETQIALLRCGLLSGGDLETRHGFGTLGQDRGIRVDCEWPSHVIEIGLDDRASARDSLHQALFAAELTGKMPLVVLIDRDGREGRYEYEMRRVADRLGVGYVRCAEAIVLRWRATAPWRDAGGDDLHRNGPVRGLCDLAGFIEDENGV